MRIRDERPFLRMYNQHGLHLIFESRRVSFHISGIIFSSDYLIKYPLRIFCTLVSYI